MGRILSLHILLFFENCWHHGGHRQSANPHFPPCICLPAQLRISEEHFPFLPGSRFRQIHEALPPGALPGGKAAPASALFPGIAVLPVLQLWQLSGQNLRIPNIKTGHIFRNNQSFDYIDQSWEQPFISFPMPYKETAFQYIHPFTVINFSIIQFNIIISTIQVFSILSSPLTVK